MNANEMRFGAQKGDWHSRWAHFGCRCLFVHIITVSDHEADDACKAPARKSARVERKPIGARVAKPSGAPKPAKMQTVTPRPRNTDPEPPPQLELPTPEKNDSPPTPGVVPPGASAGSADAEWAGWQEGKNDMSLATDDELLRMVDAAQSWEQFVGWERQQGEAKDSKVIRLHTSVSSIPLALKRFANTDSRCFCFCFYLYFYFYL